MKMTIDGKLSEMNRVSKITVFTFDVYADMLVGTACCIV